MTIIERDQFEPLVVPLVGLEVSRPWQGYGSALFLELKGMKSEASIMIQWDWRFEEKDAVSFGWADSHPLIESRLAAVRGQTVVAVRLEGRLPELVVELSGALWLRSFAPLEGDPQWAIKTVDQSWIYFERGVLRQTPTGAPAFSEAQQEGEARASDIASAAAERWDTLEVPDAPGHCDDCEFFVRLDGGGQFLDYGVCSNGNSPFDGRVVSFRSGCKAFSPER
jgi:hypothetical protein